MRINLKLGIMKKYYWPDNYLSLSLSLSIERQLKKKKKNRETTRVKSYKITRNFREYYLILFMWWITVDVRDQWIIARVGDKNLWEILNLDKSIVIVVPGRSNMLTSMTHVRMSFPFVVTSYFPAHAPQKLKKKTLKSF